MNSAYKRYTAKLDITGVPLIGTLYVGPTGLVAHAGSKFMWAFTTDILHIGSKLKFDNLDKAVLDAKKNGIVFGVV